MRRALVKYGPLPAFASAVVLLAAMRLDAMPAAERISFDDLKQRVTAAEEHTGAAIELTGYMLPADQEGELVYEFMLLAEPGACSHVAPPPANQVVRVSPDKPFEADRIYQSVRVTGTLLAENNKAQLYVLDGVRVVESGFRISAAEVHGADVASAPRQRGGKSPWRFLKD